MLLKETDDRTFSEKVDVFICVSGAIFNRVDEMEDGGWKIGR